MKLRFMVRLKRDKITNDSIFYYLVSRSAQQIRTRKENGKHLKTSGREKIVLKCIKRHENLEKGMKENHRKKKYKNTWHLLS